MMRPNIILVQKKLLSGKIGKILEGGTAVKDVQVENVKSKSELKNFIHFPWKVYKGDPNWVPPLVMDLKEKLNKEKNPFFEHADMSLFLAYKNNKITGRIAAILDENHNKVHNEKTVFFGLYESFDDVDTASSLLDKVSDWGKEKGMEALRGPMSLSMNDECAFLLEGFDSPPVILMPYNPPYYLDLMETYGLKKAKDLFAFYMKKDHKTAEKVQRIVDSVREKTSITLRPVNKKNLDEEVEKIMFIYNNAWEKNWGFVPWTENEIKYLAEKFKHSADPNIIILAEDKGKPVGLAFGLPNFNEAIKKMGGKLTPLGIIKFLVYRRKIKGIRAVIFGIVEEYRQTGLSYLLYSELAKNAKARGYEWCESSWQLEDNDSVNRFAASIGGEISKKYRIFEKRIT